MLSRTKKGEVEIILSRKNRAPTFFFRFFPILSCRSHDACEWNYTGLGLDYQLLAGPAFIAVFTVSGVVLGAAADAPLLRGRRTQLLGGCVVVFSLATALMGAATRYWHLVLLRMLLAAGYDYTYVRRPCPLLH